MWAVVALGFFCGLMAGLLAAGTVDLQHVCGPDAAAIVADIEAGR